MYVHVHECTYKQWDRSSATFLSGVMRGTFKQFKGGNPRHNFVWAKSVGEVLGKEMERWGLTVDTWGGFSWQGKTDLVFYEDTLDAPAYQDILEEAAIREWVV